MAVCKTCGEPYLTEQPHHHPKRRKPKTCQHSATYYDERGERCKDCHQYVR